MNRVDFGARTYNPTIGRWDRNDPAAELYYGYSGYNYVLNTPLSLTDPNGMWVNEGNRVTTDIPEEIAAFMDGVRGNGGRDGKKKQSERDRLSELVEVRGRLYHKNTTNRPAKLANWVNSLFGGDSDYFVEHKPYDASEQEFNDNLQVTALGVGGAYLVGEVVVGMLSSSVSKGK